MINTFFRHRLFAFVLLLPAGISILVSCHKNSYNNPNNPSGLAISSFTPASGAMNTTVVITGAGFSSSIAGNTVMFNGVVATVLSASANSLSVKVPTGARDGKITVQVNAATASSANDFTYLYTVTTFAGDGTTNFKDGTGTAAKFNLPFGLATDAAGNVYVADNNNNRIRKITPAGVVSTVAGDGRGFYKDTIALAAQFFAPGGVALDGSGNIYVGDADNKRIRKISTAGIVSTVAGDGTTNFKDSVGTAAQFYTPIGVAVDAAGNIYVADANNHRIRKIAPGAIVTTLAGNGTRSFREGTGTAAEFNFPTGVALDGEGNIYVADEGNHRIRKITPAGVVSTLAGDGTQAFREGAGTAAEFNSPASVAVDAYGNVYVADTYNYRIRKITPAGVVTTVAGNGIATSSDGIGVSAQFNEPVGIAIDATGKIYVAEDGRIRKLE